MADDSGTAVREHRKLRRERSRSGFMGSTRWQTVSPASSRAVAARQSNTTVWIATASSAIPRPFDVSRHGRKAAQLLGVSTDIGILC